VIPLPKTDPRLDLILDRTIDVPRELVWDAWTQPAHICQWFTPHPWSTAECEIDLRPGGQFRFVMRSPEGELFPHNCCYLEVAPQERLVWTTLLQTDYRPAPASEAPHFTAFITMEKAGSGTRYVATLLHREEADRARHEAMGFFEGWGAALNQLVAYARTMKSK
jgi:uncharacterized protein YndB with AHSA1/START domain